MDIEISALQRAEAMGYAVEPAGVTHFPQVSVQPVFDEQGRDLGGYQRIRNDIDGSTLAIHTGTYEMRPYHESFGQLEAAIEETSLDKRGLMTKTEFSHNGGRCFRSYLFPHVGIEGRAGDVISLQILAFDSYDGSYASSIAAGGFRHLCLNGIFFGRTIQRLKVRHVKGAALRFENALERVIDAAEEFVEMQPRIYKMLGVRIDAHQVVDLVRAMPQATQQLTDHFVAKFATEAEETTLYGLWNVLTAWASKEGGTAQSRVDRDRRVAALIESREWLRLEATA
jgi:hypothetical protein